MRRTKKLVEKFFTELRKIPVVQVACEKTGISRNSIYRWRKEDEDFKDSMEEALHDGIAFVNDMSESQLLTQIREGNLGAVRLWLTHNHERYTKRIKVEHSTKDYDLSDEQKEIIRQALSYSLPTPQTQENRE
jgi:hypothetical protein